MPKTNLPNLTDNEFSVGVVCPIEDPWNYMLPDRNIDILQMYTESAGILGADFFVALNCTSQGIYHNGDNDKIPFSSYKTFSEIFNYYPEYTRVFLSQPYKTTNHASIGLPDLKHPKKALYIIGADGAGLCLDKQEIRSQDIVVTLPLEGDLWQIACMSIVLYDRLKKE